MPKIKPINDACWKWEISKPNLYSIDVSNWCKQQFGPEPERCLWMSFEQILFQTHEDAVLFMLAWT